MVIFDRLGGLTTVKRRWKDSEKTVETATQKRVERQWEKAEKHVARRWKKAERDDEKRVQRQWKKAEKCVKKRWKQPLKSA